MSGYRWKKIVKPDWKIPEVPQGKIVIATDSAGHRRAFIRKANIQKFFGKNAMGRVILRRERKSYSV